MSAKVEYLERQCLQWLKVCALELDHMVLCVDSTTYQQGGVGV